MQIHTFGFMTKSTKALEGHFPWKFQRKIPWYTPMSPGSAHLKVDTQHENQTVLGRIPEVLPSQPETHQASQELRPPSQYLAGKYEPAPDHDEDAFSRGFQISHQIRQDADLTVHWPTVPVKALEL